MLVNYVSERILWIATSLNPTFLLQKRLELIYNFSTKYSHDNSTTSQRHCRELGHTWQIC